MLTLVPAYGRDYKSKAAVQADLDAGKDFEVVWTPVDPGGYATASDLLEDGHTQVRVRYQRKTKVGVFTLHEPEPYDKGLEQGATNLEEFVNTYISTPVAWATMFLIDHDKDIQKMLDDGDGSEYEKSSFKDMIAELADALQQWAEDEE